MTTIASTDLSNQIFGSLTVLHRAQRKDNSYPYWVCQCECGNTNETTAYNLLNGATKSCGCKNERKKNTNLQNSVYKRVYQNYKHKAKKRDLTWNLNIAEFIALVSSDCYYCGIQPSNKIKIFIQSYVGSYSGVDRQDVSIGYEPGNCVSSCAQCNYAKLAMNEADFIAWVKRIHTHLESKGKI